MDSFVEMLSMQLKLQTEKMKDGDPRELEGEDRTHFLQWNAFALEDEIHEAMAEVGWKPWASSRHVQELRFMQEMVDAFHFFMNMLIAGSGVEDPEELAALFYTLYVDKNQKNAKRQDEGYTGLDKCTQCHRDFGELEDGLKPIENKGGKFCSANCSIAYHEEKVK